MTGARVSALLLALLSASLLTYAQVENQTAAQPQSPSPAASPSPPGPADSTQLEVIKAPRPDYPAEAAEKELQGQVWIKLLISETGDVENAEIISGNPILAKAAADAMKKWKFKPFIKNGKAVKVSTKLPFDFALQGHVFEPRPPAGSRMAEPPASPSSPTAPGVADASSSRPAPETGSEPLMKLRVSQGVMEANILHRVEPAYPPEARRNHIQGTVLLQAIIGRDGRIHDVKAISGPRELIEASMGAIQQWRYRPYLLQGKPVEVETTIKVQFHM
jgi:TonB family protein